MEREKEKSQFHICAKQNKVSDTLVTYTRIKEKERKVKKMLKLKREKSYKDRFSCLSKEESASSLEKKDKKLKRHYFLLLCDKKGVYNQLLRRKKRY